MSMNVRGRPTQAGVSAADVPQTLSGDRGLDHEEPLIFELGRAGMTGVDIPDAEIGSERLGGIRR
ncbi:MAG: aminomethyl-transferring glycine dehydrogenase subunit GcvPB, partial [Alphaproteobacteria bacterium]|nr:aminomethyl-transferring glycine dehydrogenase subunit GcvPB [Alphaproteobacteria bacterium]